MTALCPYCNQLIKALAGHNYCSNKGDNIQTAKSNAFYLNSSQMYSGKHISRLSIRGVLKGYQYYRTGANDRMLKKDNYMVINEGQIWHSEIDSEIPVEAVVVAFHPKLYKQAIYGLSMTPEKLLDNPFFTNVENIHFSENTHSSDAEIDQIFSKLKLAIQSTMTNELLLDQLQFELLQLVFQKHQQSLKKSALLPAKKKFVKEELYLRLGLAKDYMIANLDQQLNLSKISRKAALSPFHFLRLFKTIFQTTPHQFLTKERMKLAHYLILNSTKTMKEIGFDTGFEHPSSFGRIYKNYFGQTPLQTRQKL